MLHPPDPETRSPRNGGNRARANRNLEVLNNFEDTHTTRHAQELLRIRHLVRGCAINAAMAEMLAPLVFGVLS